MTEALTGNQGAEQYICPADHDTCTRLGRRAIAAFAAGADEFTLDPKFAGMWWNFARGNARVHYQHIERAVTDSGVAVGIAMQDVGAPIPVTYVYLRRTESS